MLQQPPPELSGALPAPLARPHSSAGAPARVSRWDAEAPRSEAPPGFALPPPPPLLPEFWSPALQQPPPAVWSPARGPATAVLNCGAVGNASLDRPSSGAWQDRTEQVHDVLQRGDSAELGDLLRSEGEPSPSSPTL